MAARFLARRRLVVGLVIIAFALALALAAGCGSGSGDKWEGDWVNAKDSKKSVTIAKKPDGTYSFQDGPGGPMYVAKLQGNGNLTFTMSPPGANGKPIPALVILTYNGSSGTIDMQVVSAGQSLTFELKKR